MRQLLISVSKLHSLGIIHRDLNPNNIVFVEKAERGRNIDKFGVSICDFGLSTKLTNK